MLWCVIAFVLSVAPCRGQDADRSTVVTEGIVKAPVDEVWRVFSTPDGYTALGVAKTTIDLRPGGEIVSTYDKDGLLDETHGIHTRILAFEPRRMIATRIVQPAPGFPFPEAWKSVWTVVSMTDLGDGRTGLRIAMQGYGDDQESQKMREFFRAGNDWVMKKLQSRYEASAAQTGPAHEQGPLSPINLEVLIPAPRADVWAAYTTSEGWRGFLGVETSIGDAPGEPFEVYFSMAAPEGSRGSEGCTILSLVPQEMFSYTWNAPPTLPFARQQRTWVVVTFEAVSPATTRVRLRQYGFEQLAAKFPEHATEFKECRDYFASAWPRVLGALREQFEPKKAVGGASAAPAQAAPRKER
jgi:uncharacterized protein YndB with AHSA1/START domain